MLDIGHPKDVNIFSEVIPLLHKKGHSVKIYARVKENAEKLLNEYDFDYELGKYYSGMTGKAFGIITNDLILYNISRKFKPDVFVSPGSPYAAHVSKLLGKKHIAFPDTEIANIVSKIAVPFTDRIYTSKSFYLDFGEKHKRFDGYFELAYLHPNYFIPDRHVIEKYGLNGDYILVRLSALSSHHDLRAQGFSFSSEDELISLISKLEKHGKVIISSETSQWKTIKDRQLNIHPRDFHHVLFYSKLCIGEGATMASEAAVLGVPSIYVSNTERGYLNELESKYGLVLNISDRQLAIEKAIHLLENKDTCSLWDEKRLKMLEEKIDVTKFIAETIENTIS